MADCGDADGLLAGVDLVDDPVRPHSEGPEPGQAATEGVAFERLAFKKTNSVLDRIDEWPAELEQLATRSPRDHDPRHGSASASAFSQLAAQLGERDGLVAREL